MKDSVKGTILAFGPGKWHGTRVFGATRYHLWTLAEMGWRVIYIEPPWKFRFSTTCWEAPDRPFTAVTPGFVIPFAPRFAPANGIGDSWRWIASRVIAAAAGRALRKLDASPDILWLGAPWHSLMGKMFPREWHRVALCYDDLPLSPALTPARGEQLWRWEQELMSDVDLAFCTSEPIRSRRAPIARKTILVENCISPEYLPENRKKPDTQAQSLLSQLEKVPRPRVGYGGTVDLRLDHELIRAALEARPDIHIVLMGKISPLIDSELRILISSHPRLHATDTVPYEAYPHLYEICDCLIVPHKRHPFTDAMYPAKLNEYFASGKPVAAINLPELARTGNEYPGTIYLASDTSEMAAAIQAALSERSPELREKRLQVARAHTFSCGSSLIDAALNRMPPTNRISAGVLLS